MVALASMSCAGKVAMPSRLEVIIRSACSGADTLYCGADVGVLNGEAGNDL